MVGALVGALVGVVGTAVGAGSGDVGAADGEGVGAAVGGGALHVYKTGSDPGQTSPPPETCVWQLSRRFRR